MTAITTLFGALPGLLGRVPHWLRLALAGAAVLLLALAWHNHRLAGAYRQGAAEQALADRRRVAEAASAAAAAQDRLAAALAGRQSRISKGTTDALVAQNDDLARRYADLRLRWAAARADRGGPGGDATAAVSGAAAGVDDAACAAGGWVSFDTAAAAAQAADAAIAKDDAWIAWATAQAATWPE
ncbi:hypothetical protein [Sandarakinorhabdus sp. DWP1-3-1]|uniref:hypothetical protein n=1 Tax=Sandarakinorhabdus sp. DWP1-3-1 TaxID=2804627 RepID=UPI003CF5D34B